MGEGEGEERKAERSYDAQETDIVSRRSEKDCCRATRSLGKSQSGKEDSQSLVRFPNKLRICLSRSLVLNGEGRELVCPAVWCELGHVAILMHGLPAFVEFAG